MSRERLREKPKTECAVFNLCLQGARPRRIQQEMLETCFALSTSQVPGVRNIFGMHINTKQTQMQQMCVMAFSPANYQTALDGQIWILGMPLFYETPGCRES